MMFNLQMSSTNMKLLPLACLCLLTRSGTTLADEHSPVIIKVKEDSDVILPCSLSTKENIEYKVFDWRTDGQKEVFMYDAGIHYNNGLSGQDHQFKGRVSHFQDELKYGNASIIIRKTKVNDSGDYSCDFPRLQPRQIFNIKLVVDRNLKDRSAENIPEASPEPSVKTLYQTQDVALLLCEVKGASPKPTVEWQDSAGNKLPAEEPQVSETGGSFYIILLTTVMKTDRYRCVATQEEISHQIHTDIDVKVNDGLKDRSAENIPGAASKPSVRSIETKNGMLLLCHVLGTSIKPTVEWQDSAGNKLPAEEPQVSESGVYFTIILQTTVKKTDNYRCVATQEEIKHQIHTDIDVHFSGFPTGWVVGAVFVTLLVVGVILAFLVFTGRIKLSCKEDKKKPNTGNTDPSKEALSKSAGHLENTL